MLRGFFRDRITIFFTFLFPLMFLVVFGLVFGSQATESIRIGVVGEGAVLDQLPEGIVDIQHYDTLEEAQEAVRRGDIPAVVSQDGSEITLDYSAADQVRSGTIQSIVGAVVGQANQSAAGEAPQFALTAQQVEATSSSRSSSSPRGSCPGASRHRRRSVPASRSSRGVAGRCCAEYGSRPRRCGWCSAPGSG